MARYRDHTYKYWWTWEGGSTEAKTFTDDPYHVRHTHTFTEPGEHYMALEATEDGLDVPGDSKDVWVLKLEITSPDGNPSTDNHFVFDTAAHPNGQCVVHATGTTHVASEDPNMWWFSGWISGSTSTSDPDPAEGAEVEFTYTTLPSANSEFGVKELHLKHLMFESDMVMTPVEIFFPRDATNHRAGGLRTGTTTGARLLLPTGHIATRRAQAIRTFWAGVGSPALEMMLAGTGGAMMGSTSSRTSVVTRRDINRISRHYGGLARTVITSAIRTGIGFPRYRL